jgi:hypothetical protein
VDDQLAVPDLLEVKVALVCFRVFGAREVLAPVAETGRVQSLLQGGVGLKPDDEPVAEVQTLAKASSTSTPLLRPLA